MPRWAIVLTVSPLALCLGCAALGYVFYVREVKPAVSEVQGNVSEEMAAALSSSVSRRIDVRAMAAGGIAGVDEVVLRGGDLSVNTVEVPGEAGFETGPDGTQIYGVETRISPTGITLFFPGVTYSAVPVVADGGIELTRIEAGENLLGFFFTEDAFEEAIEGGINDALRDHGLTPTSLTLRPGVLTIQVVPATCLGGAGGIGGCDPATSSAHVAR